MYTYLGRYLDLYFGCKQLAFGVVLSVFIFFFVPLHITILFLLQFRYTATERAQQSARYFTNGLFDRAAKDVIFSPATKVDLVLRVINFSSVYLVLLF